MMNWRVIPGHPLSTVVIHVPHSSRVIPQALATTFLLLPRELEAEAELMADVFTADLAVAAATSSRLMPWIFENQISRLVFDPERFPDEREVMNKVGMGVVYSKTHDQQDLRTLDKSHTKRIIQNYFQPYSDALEDLVASRLQQTGHLTIIDLHSYPASPLPYELNQTGARPILCLGVDSFHTPGALVGLARRKLSRLGDIAINTPFAGTYVPLAFYGREPRVESIMLELRKDGYLSEQKPGPGFKGTYEAIANFVNSLEDRWKP
jgi:N-formylglutamate amidohydrolase